MSDATNHSSISNGAIGFATEVRRGGVQVLKFD
jgi:hypothetical protein